MCLENVNERLNSRYLFEVLVETNMRAVITGSAQPQITRKSLTSLRIPVPPLCEQEKWLIELETLQNAERQVSANNEAIQKMLDALRETIFAP